MTDTSAGSVERISRAVADRYRIERELGAGGMATVYLAEDLKHGRRVALKVLRPELAAVIGADRFLAEIKTTAALQHPHILPLHDSGEADNTVFYVMPFVEGESLRDRLRHEKQLPVDEAIRIAREVASALDYAHRHGVVHRDIKPENILLHEGQALVADFGIALAVSRSDGASRMTETGMSLGTPHYMAPEQAMGEREITPKADVYALGCVLYEMLTGDPPFTGSTAQAIVARTLTESPRRIVMQRHTVPEHIEAAVFMALEKLPADRFASAGEFAAALDNPALSRSVAHAAAPMVPATRVQRVFASRPALIVAGVAAGALLTIAWSMSRAPAAAGVARYALSFPNGQEPVLSRTFTVSRDGRHLLFSGPAGPAQNQLWIKDRDAETAVPLNGTNGAARGDFSPDGEWVAFVGTDQKLRKMQVTGGSPVVLADSAAPARGVAWLDDGSIVYVGATSPIGREVRRVSDAGGPSETLWKSAQVTAWNPSALPGARKILFVSCGGGAGCAESRDLVGLDLKSGNTTVLARGAVAGFFVPTGHLLFVRPDGALMAQRFDPGSLKVSGSPLAVRDSISLGVNETPEITVSDNGVQFIRPGGSLGSVQLFEFVYVDRLGRETPIDSTLNGRLTVQGSNAGWSLSPDGKKLAIGLNTKSGDDIWVKQLPTGALTRVTLDSLPEHRPRWAPDGKSFTFIRYFGANDMGVFRVAGDGTGSVDTVLHKAGALYTEAVMTPDSRYLVVRRGGTTGIAGNRDIMMMRLGTDTAPAPLIASAQFDESSIAISPDGRWIAYESDEGGRSEVSIRPFPNAATARIPVSTSGGQAPVWSKNGRELFFVSNARDMMVASITPGASVPVVGQPQRLFRMRPELYLQNLERYTPFDITADGRFIMGRLISRTASSVRSIVVTENWFEELRGQLNRK